jgi:hypothetical protein
MQDSRDREPFVSEAINLVIGDEVLPEYVDYDLMENAATSLATWVFTSYEEKFVSVDEEEQENVWPDLIATAIAAAYLAGSMDASNQPTEQETETISVSGKDRPITITINIT